jgi:predicted ATP-binding protein involved in virulence
LVIANGLRNSSLEGDGVVLIDELDLHLHPEWQRGIVAALKKTFPNLQFICTTHSAQILSTITDYDIFIVENGAIFNPSSNPLGRDNDDILEEIMGTSKRPKDVEKLISDIFHGLANSIIDFDSIERQKNLLAILVSPEDPIHNKIQSILERRKILAS